MNIDKYIKEWAEQVNSDNVDCLEENINGMTNFEYGTTVWKDENCKDCSDGDALVMWFNASEGKKHPNKSVDDYSISELFSWATKEVDSQDMNTNESSESFSKAKKIGYLGDDEEEKVQEWLNSAWAKWSQHCLDVFTRVSGDEQKGLELFNEYENIGSIDGFASRWSNEEKRYMKPQEFLEKFKNKVPAEDPEVKELLQKLEKKWSSDNKGVAEYYATSDSRGRYTGD